MDINEMTLVEVEERLAALEIEVRDSQDVEELKALATEKTALVERKKELVELEERKASVEAIAKEEKAVETVEVRKMEDLKMDVKEVRNSQEYIKAYAEYIKTGDDAECRAMLSENVSGDVAVPDMVVNTIQTAWDNEPIMALVKKTYLKGNVKIGFEISADGAVEHVEGSAAVEEEDLVLGIATLTPVSIKKWISISDEVLDLAGEAFLQYIYAELGYQIAKKCADEIIADIVATTAVGSATVPAQAVVKSAVSLSVIAEAVANLSDEASNPTVVMNKLTYASFKSAQANANYGQDIFDGLDVVFNNSIPAYGTASEDDCYVIVGDFGRGAMANFPNGEAITFKFDDKTLMESDLVKVLGRMYCGHAVVAPKCFTKITKPAQG